MANAVDEFVACFREFMRSDGVRPRLEALIRKLSADPDRSDNADACLKAYFKASSDPAYPYDKTGPKSLWVFGEVAFVAIDRGMPLYSVRFDALVHAAGTPWQERFSGLKPAQKARLATRAAQQMKALSLSQRRLLAELPRIVKDGRSGTLDNELQKTAFRETHGCLLAYMEASLRYPPDNFRSLQVFNAVATYTIRKGDGDFVRQFRKLVADTGTTWWMRWNAVDRFPLMKQMLEKELSDAALRADLAKRAIGPPQPVSVTTPAPQLIGQDAIAGQSRRRPDAAFLELFEKFLGATDEKTAKQYELKLSERVFAKSAAQLADCLSEYLLASTRYPADNTRSLHIFWGIASLLVNRGEAYESLKLERLRNTPGTVVAKRFAALAVAVPDTYRKLSAEMANRIRKCRVLDDLKLEYFKVHHDDPRLDLLRCFDPAVDPSYRDAVRGAARDCDRTFGMRDGAAFAKSFDAWADLMHAQTDPQVFIAMLKWCRECPDIDSKVRSELYWYGVLALLTSSVRRAPDVYGRGLNQEEQAFFLDSKLVAQAYRYDFDRRHDYVVKKHATDANLKEVSRAHALLLFQARKMDMTLVAMDEAATVRDGLEKLKDDKDKSLDDVRIPISTGQTLTLGTTVGSVYIVWWESRRSQVYVEVEGFGQVLFKLESYLELGRLKREDATYGQIWRSTRHLLGVLPVFFQVLGYLPDLVSGGFTALVRSVVTDLVVDQIAERLDLGTGGTLILSAVTDGMVGNVMDRALHANGVRVGLDPQLDDIAGNIGHGAPRLGDLPPGPRASSIDTLDSRLLDAPAPQVPSTQSVRATHPAQKLLEAPKFKPSEIDTALAVGLDPQQVRDLGGVLGKRFDSQAMAGFAPLWKRARADYIEDIQGVQRMFEQGAGLLETAERARVVFGKIRDDVWLQIRTGTDATSVAVRDRLERAGIVFHGEATAPSVAIRTPEGWDSVQIHIDHIAELGQHPMKAFSPNNFQLAFARENTVLLNLLHAMDPFQPTYDIRRRQGRGISRAGKAHGIPNQRRKPPIAGLLADPNAPAVGASAAADASAAIDEQLKRLSAAPSGVDWF